MPSRLHRPNLCCWQSCHTAARSSLGGGVNLKRKAASALHMNVAREGLDCILGAAYLMTDEAYVFLDGDRAKVLRVTLQPKRASRLTSAVLHRRFRNELAAQKVRWAVANRNRPLRESLTGRAVRGEPLVDPVAAEKRREIEMLLGEVDAEIRTLGPAQQGRRTDRGTVR